MRVIGGKYRGRQLMTQIGNHQYRPSKSLIREFIANTINHGEYFTKEEKVTFFDLCCGSGSCGIEALSHGVSFVTFADIKKEALKLVWNNVINLQISLTSFQIINLSNVEQALAQLNCQQYNIIYLDPPYKYVNNILSHYSTFILKILKQNGILLVESFAKTTVESPSNYQLIKSKKYGNTKISIFKIAKT